ncbi:MAG: DNA-binding protein [Acidobacteria bacterium]|nr:MAG: DNA-binding protein [Acidobacteriota bacterium]
MFLDIHELEREPLDFEEEVPTNVLDLGGEVRQRTPLKALGHAEVVEEHHGKHEIIKDIRLRGRLTAGLELLCARCIEPVPQDIVREFELLYRPLGVDAGRDELSVTDAEAEIGYYQGDGLLLEDVLREQVLLALPLKVTCREDCKGLCPHCGKNLNEEQCSCTVAVEDPRWTALREIRSKLEH